MKPAVCHILSAAGAAARGDVVYRLDLLLFVVAADLLVVHLSPKFSHFLRLSSKPCLTRLKNGLPIEFITMPTTYFFWDMERALAEPFTSYSLDFTISMIFSASALLTFPRPLITRSTVPRDVPASLAISEIVILSSQAPSLFSEPNHPSRF